MERCLDCRHSVSILNKSGCTKHGHTIEDVYAVCNDFLCEFCECKPCMCDEEYEE